MARAKKTSNGPGADRFVDMWALAGAHPTNIDLLRRLRSADDRQFGANMDVCGSISERDSKTGKWEETRIVAIRSDVWNPGKEKLQQRLKSLQERRRDQLRRAIQRSGRLDAGQTRQLARRLQHDPVMRLRASDLFHRRLVMKMFHSSGARIRWAGSIEEVTTREVHNSLGSRRRLLSLAAILPGYDYVIALEQNHRTFRIPAVFTFSFFDEQEKQVHYVSIKRKWISVGADFAIASDGRRIGEIDGQLLSFGFNARVSVCDPALAENRQLVDLLTLFTATVGYHRAMRGSVRRRVRAVAAGTSFQHLVEDEEVWLLKNPRRRAA